MRDIKPYTNTDNKKKQIITMFNNIANKYDFLNHLLSFRMDIIWRKIAIKKIKNNPKKILDIATGTADLAITAAKYTDAIITGIDISKKMLDIGKEKILNKQLSDRITLQLADAEKLPFNNNSFHAITAGFGVRNFEDIDTGLLEMHRVLDTNGILIILEPSKPTLFPIKQLFNFYFTFILPVIGKMVSKDINAYKYLTNSVKAFPSKEFFVDKLKKNGFKNCTYSELTFGIVTLYIAEKN